MKKILAAGKKQNLGKGIGSLIKENKIERPSYIEIPYPRETLSPLDVFAVMGMAFGFIAFGMALK